jgi:hypothetical protein
MRTKPLALVVAASLLGMAGSASAQDLPAVGQIVEAVPLPTAQPPAPAPKRAAKGSKRFVTGIDATSEYTAADAARWFDTTVDLGAGLVRIDVSWRSIASGEPANPSDPSDPAYDFSALDGAVNNAAARNLNVLFTFFNAPGFGQEGGGKPNDSTLPEGAWKPKSDALGSFAKAVATRYSGSFDGLPRVSDFEPWNEANLNGFMAPQYDGKKLVSADRYRDLVIAVNDAVDSVHPDNRVVVGSLAPYGDEPGTDRSRPLVFLRDLLCLNKNLKKTKCPQKTPVDVLSHHPIDTSGGPRRSAIDDDDVATPDLGNVEKLLRAAEREGTIAGKRRHHPLWATEFWWSTDKGPDDPSSSNPNTQARYVEESLYLFWKAGAEAAVYFTLLDTNAEIGLFFQNGEPKPATTAFRFPFVTERKSKQKVFAWGKAPVSGRVTIEEKAGNGWRKVHSENVNAGNVFTADLKIKGKAKLRASTGSEESLVWTQKG